LLTTFFIFIFLPQLGADVSDSVIEERMAATKPGHCAILIYTSGTTGNPKACMISHDGILFESACVMACVPTMGQDMSEPEHIM
jgi:long-subunit acyl-CoA synthetase (AMP-forming)